MTSSTRTDHRLVLFADAVATAEICSIVTLLGRWSPHPDSALGFDPVFVVICTAVLILALRLKHSRGHASRFITVSATDSVSAIFGATLMATLVVLSVGAIFPASLQPHLPPGAVVSAYACCALALPIVNVILSTISGRRLNRPTRVVVLGTGVMANDVAARLRRSPQVDLVGFVDDDPMEGEMVLGSLDDLPSICDVQAVDHVVVAFSNSHPERTAWILRQLNDRVTVDIVPRFFELTGWESELHDLHGLTVVTMGGSAPPSARMLKRAVDLAISLSVLILISPLLLVLGLMIRLESPGPALFHQTRLGRNREPFEILKFRTMRCESEDGALSTNGSRSARWASDNNRKTALGKWLRRTGLDELPQLINVLRGEMSFVGPRPLIAEECAALPVWAERRFDMRPGITGIWQVSGQHELRPDELHRLDCQYTRDWSFRMDLRIIALTPGRLLRGGGRGETMAPGWDKEVSRAVSGPARIWTRQPSPAPDHFDQENSTSWRKSRQNITTQEEATTSKERSTRPRTPA